MPNRILKESVCTSEQIDALTPEQEVFFYRLITACDDFGLMDARPKILASRCYPLKSIDSKCIQEMLAALQVQGLVILYEVDGRPFLKMTGWEKHQQIRAKRAKYPTPEQGREITCNQVQSNVPVIQSNPIQSNDEPPEPVGSASSSDDPRKRLFDLGVQILTRSEERRVGKECRTRWSPTCEEERRKRCTR